MDRSPEGDPCRMWFLINRPQSGMDLALDGKVPVLRRWLRSGIDLAPDRLVEDNLCWQWSLINRPRSRTEWTSLQTDQSKVIIVEGDPLLIDYGAKRSSLRMGKSLFLEDGHKSKMDVDPDRSAEDDPHWRWSIINEPRSRIDLALDNSHTLKIIAE